MYQDLNGKIEGPEGRIPLSGAFKSTRDDNMTMKKTTLGALMGASALGMIASPAFGQMNSGMQMNIVQKGVKSVGASGSYFTSSGNHTTNVNLTVSQFITQDIEVLGGLNYLDVNGSTNTGFKLGGRYYFSPSQDKQTLPFAGVFYQYNTGSGLNQNSFGLEAGIQYFVAPNVSVTPSLVYTTTTGNGNSNTSFGVQFGLTFWFK